MTRRRAATAALTLLLAVLGAGLGLAAPARAATLSEIGTALRSSSVFVDPAVTDPAHTLTDAQAQQLRDQIAATKVPIFVAVVAPGSVGGETDPRAVLAKLNAEVGISGVYAVVLDGESARFLATATGPRAAEVSTMATTAATSHRGDLPGALQEFVGAVGTRYGAGSGTPTNPAATLVPLGIGAVVVGGGGYWLYRRSRAATAAKVAAVRGTLEEDITAYGELVAGLDTDDPQLAGEGQRDAQQALDAYEKAKSAAAAMTRPEDASAVTEALEEGRFLLACVEARRTGSALPQRRPPCFLDPRHGPSTEDVQWAPDGGAPRAVPVCAVCATQLAQGQLPAAREVEVSGRRVPYWRAGGAYQPYASGYYSNFAGVLPAILVGSTMGAMMGGGPGGAHGVDTSQGTGPDGGWGGDLGGGWGGDGGGGGFGGGDFGGGDFGGGDF